MTVKIVTGGQTGVDRAALDVADELGLPAGGWCPRYRQAEDGPIALHYPLQETPSPDYAQRTEWNVRAADGTLILARGQPAGGTALTMQLAQQLHKPCLVLDLAEATDVAAVLAWILGHSLRVLNVAGPRESQCPGVYAQAVPVLRELFALWIARGQD